MYFGSSLQARRDKLLLINHLHLSQKWNSACTKQIKLRSHVLSRTIRQIAIFLLDLSLKENFLSYIALPFPQEGDEMLRKKTFSPWMLSLLVLLLAATALAQTTASIQGTVSDQSGAAIVGAKVTVKNTALGIERTTQTSSSGGYEVPALPPGTYSVQVQMTGFETQLAKEVVLEVSKNSVQNFGLKVASTTEVVTVEATAPVIESTTMTVGQTIDQRTVQDIPLNGRHFVDLALLIPGTVTPPQS